jgi:hypothetical protein
MRTILVDVGPLAHLSGDRPNYQVNQGLLDEETLIAHEKGIVVEGNEIIAIGNSERLDLKSMGLQILI